MKEGEYSQSALCPGREGVASELVLCPQVCSQAPTTRQLTNFCKWGKRGFVDYGPSLSEIVKVSVKKMILTKAVQDREWRYGQWQSATTERNLDQLDAFVCQQLQLGQVGLEHIAIILDRYTHYTIKIIQGN